MDQVVVIERLEVDDATDERVVRMSHYQHGARDD